MLFYDRLFEVAPSVRAMFPEDMTEQRKKLMGTLAARRQRSVESRNDFSRGLERSAKRHVAYGAKAEHYPVVGAALAVDAGEGPRRGLDARTSPRPGPTPTAVAVRLHDSREAYGAQAAGRRVGDALVSEPLVIVGNGMAAARLVDELAKSALGRYAIAVIGDEPRLAYNRVLLSSVLAGETASHRYRAEAGDVVARPRRHPALRLPRHRDRHRPPRSSRSPATRASRFRSSCSPPARRRCG